MSIKVSVITPIYNREKFVPQMLACLRNQTLQDIEFLIINDCSEDKTLPQLQELTSGDKRFRILSEKQNSGPSVCRNWAMELAQGEYIGFFDSDDKIPEDYFLKLWQTAEASGADIVFAAYNGWRHTPGCIKYLSEKIKALRNGAIWDKLYRTSMLRDNHIAFAEGLYTADNLFNLRAFYYAAAVELVNSPVYRYALQRDSIGRAPSREEKRKKDILEICRQMREFAAEKNFSKSEIKELGHFIYRTYPDYSTDAGFQKQLKQQAGVFKSKLKPAALKPYKGATMTTGLLKTMRLLHLINKEKYNEKRYVELVKASPLFDTKWYLAQNPDVKARKISAARHYVKFGWKEGRNPSPKFDNNAYLAEYEDVAAAGLCPLVHYLISGSKEGRYYQSVDGVQGESSGAGFGFSSLKEKLKYALEYPIRLQEECDRLKAEIKALENTK